jgi:hypothetical protein
MRDAHVVGAIRGFIERPAESYSRGAWLVRTAVRNVQWARREGVARLVEEHDLHPLARAARAGRKARWRRAHGVAPGEARAVFLTGVPRSGTNMIVRGLATLPEVEVRNEGDRDAFSRYRLRPDPVVRDLVARSRHRVVLLKPLLDSHRLGSLMDDLDLATPARAVWAYRDVDSRVRSALSKFGPAALVALRDVAAGAPSGAWQSQGLSPRCRELICAVDWDGATPADAAALVWYVKNLAFFEMRLDRRPDVLAVSYDELVRDPDAGMRRVCTFVGVGWRPSVSAHIDRRARRPAAPVALDPAIRALCDDMSGRLDAVAGRR